MSITGCNLCLETITTANYFKLEGALKDKLQVLIPVINWGNICRDPKVCHKCSKIINRTYDFKIFCLDNNKRLQKSKKAKEDSVEISNSEDTEDSEEEEKCCLCCQEDISEDFEVANVNLKEMVQKCFPQLNIYSSDNQGSCKKCLKVLKRLDSFTDSCLDSEKYVKDYCSSMDIIRRDRFNFDECIKRKHFPSAIINNENSGTTVQETVINDNTQTQTTQIPIGESLPQEKDFQSNVGNSEDKSAESSSDQKKTKRNEKSRYSGKFRCGECNYAAKAKSALASHMMKHKDPSKTKMHKCEVCGHETKRKGDLKWHMIVHKNPEDVVMYYCANCPYKTKRKADLKQHVVVHQSRMFKCDFCSFKTKNQFYLDTFHMLLHKDSSKMKIIKCKLCPFETRGKRRLGQHSKVHYEKLMCNWCDFTTVYKSGLRKHLITHKCHSEREHFKCYLCDFETGSKESLKCHVLIHSIHPKVMYECEKCTFKSKRKRHLVIHMKKHQDRSNLKVFGCELCTYKTDRKGNLKSHLISHISYLKTLSDKRNEEKTLTLQLRNLSKP